MRQWMELDAYFLGVKEKITHSEISLIYNDREFVLYFWSVCTSQLSPDGIMKYDITVYGNTYIIINFKVVSPGYVTWFQCVITVWYFNINILWLAMLEFKV